MQALCMRAGGVAGASYVEDLPSSDGRMPDGGGWRRGRPGGGLRGAEIVTTHTEADPATALSKPSGIGSPPLRKAALRVELSDGLRATLPGWLLAHALVLAVCFQLDHGNPFQPLYAWDTHWYLFEANAMAHGGSAFADGGLAHFFPLTPLFAAGLAIVTRLPVAFALFASSWVLALLFGALVHVIAIRENGDRIAARRAAALSQLAPGAFALVMGYSEPLAGVLAAAYFLAVRRERTGWAVLAGLLAGISRPTGLVLALPGFIEAVRAVHRAGWKSPDAVGGTARAAAPVLGLAAYLGYCQVRFHDWLLPYTQQVMGDNRGGIARNPISTIQVLADSGAIGILVTSLAGAVISAAALVICRRRLPISYTAWSAVMFVLSITSPGFTSEPRYLAAIFPLLIAAPLVLRKRAAWYAFTAVSLGLMYWVAWLALGLHQVA
jgi:hypothetical protein